MVRFLLALAALWTSGFLVRVAIPEQMQRPENQAALEVYEDKPATSLVGEFRNGLSSYLWAKADEYIHGGMAMRPMTDREKASGLAGASSGDNVECAHEGETSVIPDATQDTRGILGDWERAVKPYFPVGGHKHRPLRETLPLYRFMTWAEPNFVPGYVIGSFVIYASDHNNVGEMISFLREGVKNNPTSIALPTEYGRALFTKAGLTGPAEHYLLAAVRNAQRPARNEFEKDSIVDAYRWLVLLYRKEGRADLAFKWAQQGIQRFPDDPVIAHTIEHHGEDIPLTQSD